MQVGLMTKNYRWIITNLDAHTIDLEPFQYSGTIIKIFRISDTNHMIFKGIGPAEDNLDQFDNPSITNEKDNFYSNNCAAPNEQLINSIPIYPDRFNSISNLIFLLLNSHIFR